MADQEAYQDAMNEAADAAWEQDWTRAIEAYQKAIRLSPNDSQALAGLALSLMGAGHTNEALKTYERVSQIVPGDPLPQEKMGEIYEQIDQPKEASKKYLAVAEIYFARKDTVHALANWENAVQLDPNQAQAYVRLASIYERSKGATHKAILAYIALARILQQLNHVDRAEQFLQRGLDLDATDNDVRTALAYLKQGQAIDPIDTSQLNVGQTVLERQEAQKEQGGTSDDVESEEEEDFVWDEGAIEGRTPTDEAAHYSMGLLSDMVFNGEVPGKALSPLVSALEYHQVGDAAGAIELYTEAMKAGVEHDALRFNLGLLYQYERRHGEAIDILEKAAESPEYKIAANQALGKIYLAEGEVRQAARHMTVALREADLRVNIKIDENGYERLRAGLTEQPLDQLTDLARGIDNYLDDPHWESKFSATHQSYITQGRDSYVTDLVELVMEGGRPEMAAIMDKIDAYLQKGLLRLAMDEVHYAIERAPDYLPAHRRVADILVREGRNQAAAEKINLVAETYLIRGNGERAADLLSEVLEIWPTDMSARERVIEMLREQGRVGEALKHYAEMADQFYRIRFDQMRAIEIYNEALKFARQNNAVPSQMIRILKAMADIEAAQLNWSNAIQYYEQCRDLAPDDEDVIMELVDLNFQTGDAGKAIAALDDYMRYCIQKGNIDQIISTLEKQVRLRGNEVALRQRLAEVYKQQGRTAEAIAQMDAIGEMLLEAGRIDEARIVIQQLIELNPADKAGYEQLLASLQ